METVPFQSIFKCACPNSEVGSKSRMKEATTSNFRGGSKVYIIEQDYDKLYRLLMVEYKDFVEHHSSSQNMKEGNES
jgi:hypothetical protein